MALEILSIGEGQASSSVICKGQVGLWFPIFRWMGEGQKLLLREILFSTPEDSQITQNSRGPSSQSWCERCCDGIWRNTMHGGVSNSGWLGIDAEHHSTRLFGLFSGKKRVRCFVLFSFQNCFCLSASLSLGKHPQLIFALKLNEKLHAMDFFFPWQNTCLSLCSNINVPFCF